MHAKKLDYLVEMDTFHGNIKTTKTKITKRPKNLNRPVTSKEIESVIKNLSTKKSPRPDGFTGEFFRQTPVLLRLPQKIEEKATLPNSFCEAGIDLIPKPDKDPKGKLQTKPVCFMNIDAQVLNKMLANRI